MKKSVKSPLTVSVTAIEILTLLFIAFSLLYVVDQVGRRSLETGDFAMCQANLKNLSLSIESYHRDHHRYPASIAELKSCGYIRAIPRCPCYDDHTYAAGYTCNRLGTMFTLHCTGYNHALIEAGLNRPLVFEQNWRQ